MTSIEGHLEYPYQPFGEFEICLAYNKGTTHRNYTTKYKNETEAGPTLPNILTEGTSNRLGKSRTRTAKPNAERKADNQQIPPASATIAASP